MADRSTRIRNVALVGHGDSGKTTFAESALHLSGVIGRKGSVRDGTTISDFDPDERDRCHSIDVTCLHLPWRDHEVQILDCPGYPDFSGAALSALGAVDTAVVFVNASGGLGINTRRSWGGAERLGKARIIAISKMDLETADPQRVLDQVRAAFGDRCLPYNLPVGKGAGFKGVVPCFGPESDGADETSADEPESCRQALLDAVVEADDALMEKYLEEAPISQEELQGALRKAIAGRTVFPVVFLSSEKGEGVSQLLDLIVDYAPSAATPLGVKATDPAGGPVDLSVPGPFVATVFKVTSDIHVGKLSFLRVWRGSLPADGMVWASSTGHTVKLAHPTRPQGKDHANLKTAEQGDVFCIAKVDDLKLGTTVSDPSDRVTVAPTPIRPSMVQLAVEPKARGEEHKISAALQKICDEDPSFRAARNPETNELVVSGRSSLHLDICLKRMAHRYKVEVTTHLPVVPLKETCTGAADGHHRHKKQTGGRGQFAEVYLRVRPTERGEGFSFTDKTVGGSIPSNFIPAVEKGVRETLGKGAVAGFEVVDVAVEVYDGKHHPVDSSEAAFKIAGQRAFRDAFSKAHPVLLEPVMNVEIDVPSQFMGEISGDLNTRRGRISGMDSHGDHQVVRAQVPLREMLTYSTDLRSMTSGEGAYSMAPDHLDVVPAHLAKQIMEAFSKSRTEED